MCKLECLALLAVFSSCLFFDCYRPAWADEPHVGAVPRFALLVGVESYPNLGKAEQLNGCANDVAAMHNLLVERFSFGPNNITTLVDDQATGKAIRAALASLVQQVQNLPAISPPAQIVFHFSGHGSQVYDQETGADRDEPDGLDETLVPYDATKQGGNEDIRDDELFQFVENICGDGRAKMWLVLDCCHSGSGARGVTKLRKLDRELSVRVASQRLDASIYKRKLPAGAILLAACRDREVEPEYDENGSRYGLLTRFLVQVLNEEQNVTKLTYRLLRESIVSRYRQDPSVTLSPSPQMEGEYDLLNAGILGAIGIDRPPHWEVLKDGTDRTIALFRAGAFHGVTTGSIYEVYMSPEQIELKGKLADHNGSSVLWLKIETVEGATAKGRVFRWEAGEQIEDRLSDDFTNGYAVERFHAGGGFELRLRVVQTNHDNLEESTLDAESDEIPAAIREQILSANQPEESPWLRWVSGQESCDFVLRLDGSFGAIFPAAGLADVPLILAKNRGDVPRSLVGGWGPFESRTGKTSSQPQGQPITLANYLRSIARARNLLRLANTQVAMHNAARSDGSLPIQVKLELIAVDAMEADEVAIKKSHPIERVTAGIIMRDRMLYAFQVTNENKTGKPIYVTVLSIDSNLGIDQVLPFQNGIELIGEQLLAPGESRITDVFECDANHFPGQRWAVALATREQNDFYMLSQPSLPTARGQVKSDNQSLNQLLMQQTYFQPQSRGVSRRPPVKLYDDSWSSSTIEWLALRPED